MREIPKIAGSLFEKIRDRFGEVTLGDENAKATATPEDARFFNFDYVVDGKNYGNITVSVIDEISLKVYFSKNISHDLDEDEKQEWYSFLRELREFARRNLLSFEPRDITRSTLKHRDIQQVSKADSTFDKGDIALAESRLYGSAKSSYEKDGNTRIIVRHSERVDPEKRGARTRKINSIFVETSEGERFKLPHNSLRYARAIARHVSEGGDLNDEFGQHITEVAGECSKLRPFKNHMQRRTFEDVETKQMVEAAFEYHALLNNTLKKMGGHKGYVACKEAFETNQPLLETDVDIEALRERFVRRVFDDRMEEALPIVQKAYHMKKHNKLAQQFESWADDVVRKGTSTGVEELLALFQKDFPVGVDAINATAALDSTTAANNEYYDALVNALLVLASEDPQADARQTILDWMEEEMPYQYQAIANDMGDVDQPEEQYQAIDEGTCTIGDNVDCPNGVSGKIIADLGSKWLIKDDAAETDDDELEFNKSDCALLEHTGCSPAKIQAKKIAEASVRGRNQSRSYTITRKNPKTGFKETQQFTGSKSTLPKGWKLELDENRWHSQNPEKDYDEYWDSAADQAKDNRKDSLDRSDDSDDSEETLTEGGKYWDNADTNGYNKYWGELVPAQGKTETLEGELLRAASRIYYDLFNNGFGNNWTGALNFLNKHIDANISQASSILEPYAAGGKVYRANYDNDPIVAAADSLLDKVLAQITAANGQYHPSPGDMFDLQEKDAPWQDEDDEGDYDSDFDRYSDEEEPSSPNPPGYNPENDDSEIEFERDIDESDQMFKEDNEHPAKSAIIRRIMNRDHALLGTYGPVKVMKAVDDVVSGISRGLEEIGTSDVSIWVKQVEGELEHMGPEEVVEGHGLSTTLDRITYNGQMLELDQWTDGSRTISHAKTSQVLKSGNSQDISTLWGKIKAAAGATAHQMTGGTMGTPIQEEDQFNEALDYMRKIAGLRK